MTQGLTGTLPKIVLQPRRAKPFFARHPWVYAGAIAKVQGEPGDGAEVAVVSHEGQFIARGLYNSQSNIRVRLFSWQADVAIDAEFFREKLTVARQLRYDLLHYGGPGRACRLVFSEADGLPGCTVDQYDHWLVVQLTSLGLAQRRDLLAQLLQQIEAPQGIYLRTERGIGLLEGLALQDGLLLGAAPTGPVVIEEAGVKFLVDLTEGQKTGFYLDQRDNRAFVARFAQGRRVLDAFCYTGGFGLHAARAGASEVVGVDVSETALALARENAQLNGLHPLQFRRGDVFDELSALADAKEQFGLVILDPPKFARTQHAIDEALRGYRRLVGLALKLLTANGVLVLCCCSGLITEEMLRTLLAQLAADSQRVVQILACLGQSADHPVSASCQESNYLKCFVCRVP